MHFDIWSFDNYVKDIWFSLGAILHVCDENEGQLIFQRIAKTLSDIQYNRDYNLDKIKEILIFLEKVQPLFKNSPFHLKNDINEFCEQLTAINKTIDLFHNYSKNISENEEESINRVLNNEAYVTHHDIYYSQQIFKIIINRFVNGISLNEYRPLEKIIERYDSNFKANLFLNKCKIKYEHSSMRENDFLQSPPDHLKKQSYETYKDILEKNYMDARGEKITPPEKEEFEAAHNMLKRFCLESYDLVSNYFFIEFLKGENNFKLFKLCDSCKQYFISGKFDCRIKFCSNCSSKSKMSKDRRREYQRKYRQKKKQEKLAREREARIKNLMNKGWTRKEAGEIIEADESMM